MLGSKLAVQCATFAIEWSAKLGWWTLNVASTSMVAAMPGSLVPDRIVQLGLLLFNHIEVFCSIQLYVHILSGRYSHNWCHWHSSQDHCDKMWFCWSHDWPRLWFSKRIKFRWTMYYLKVTIFAGINVWYFCGLAHKRKILYLLTLTSMHGSSIQVYNNVYYCLPIQ